MSKSFYTKRLDDPKAFYLDQGFGVCGDGKTDDTAAIQSAINKLYETVAMGVLFIPEGDYLISDTILVPRGVRLIGYGAKRPRIRLKDNAPGFAQPVEGDKGGSRYMIWITDNLPQEPGGSFGDANAGTFYGSLENLDFYAGEGNTNAVIVRSHVAQNTFMAHCDFHIESGRAGIFDVGNASEDLHFYGGQYGIISTTCSPGWPFVLLDSSFEGQSEAAVRSYCVGFTAIRVQVKNTPTFLYVEDHNIEKLFIQDSLLENITKCAISTDSECNPANQLNALNIHCRNVPVFSESRLTGERVCAESADYVVDEFTQGHVVQKLGDWAHYEVIFKTSSLADAPALPESDIPAFPDMDEWVNIHTLGARGDGRTDDTAAFQQAIEKHKVIYVPQGVYILSDTLKLKHDTALIGMHSYATQLRVADRTSGFDGFGSPKALLETPEGGDNLVNSLCIDTGGANQQICGILWRGSEKSCLRDIKMNGGHGTESVTNDARITRGHIYNGNGTDDNDPLRDWDNQYPSLWITGGGVFTDIWSASMYASMGLFVDNPTARGKIYCMSLEHHVRKESRFKNVHGWSIYAMQTEEVPDESSYAVAHEFENCKDILMANTFCYRVSKMRRAYPHAIRVNNCENITFYGIHNFAQSRYAFDSLVYDVTSGKEERFWELAKLTIDKPVQKSVPVGPVPQEIYGGFMYADGGCVDSKGNFYFTDTEAKRIYRVDGESLAITVEQDLVVKPISVFCDTEDNLIIVADYKPSRTIPLWASTPRFLGHRFANLVVFTVKNGEICPLPIQTSAPDNAFYVYSGTRLRMKGGEMGVSNHIKDVTKKLVPSFNRYVYSGSKNGDDFVEALLEPVSEYYVAPDGITVLPRRDDLFDSRFLTGGRKGDKLYILDEFFGRTFRFTIGEGGTLCAPELIAQRGNSCVTVRDEKLYICDGQLTVYSQNGEQLDQICIPERPSHAAFIGANRDTLIVTGRRNVYACKMPCNE